MELNPGARVRLFVVLLAATSAGLWSTVPGLRGWTWPDHGLVFVFAAAFLLAERAQVHVELRRHTFSLSLSEVPLLLGVFLLPPGWLLVCRVTGGAAALLVQRTPRLKAGFNLAMWALEPALAVLCVYAVLPHPSGGPAEWAAGLLALLAVDLVDVGALLSVMTLMQERLPRQQFRILLPASAMSGAVNSAIGLAALVMLEADPRSAVLLAALGAILVVAYRAYSGLLRRHANLDRLSQFTAAVAAADPDPKALMRTALKHIREAMQAEYSCVWLEPPAGGVQVVVSQDGGVEHRNLGSILDQVRRAAMDNGRSGLLAATTHPLTSQPSVRDGIVVPLVGKGERFGALEVGNRLTELGTFDADDMRFLQALAAHAGVALDHQELLDRLRYEASHDSLTGLANRAEFTREATGRIEACREAGDSATVLLMDLDRFKDVNDTLGHHAGDQLLQEVARRLRAKLPDSAVIARLGGDEFAVFLDAPGHDAAAFAHRIQTEFGEPIRIDGFSLEANASIGMARFPVHATDAETLLQRADIAMYAAKSTASGYQYYAEGLDHSSPRRLALVSELRQAITGGQLVLNYQPKVRLSDRTLSGVEALVRWDHPIHGMVMPDEFIPIAEHTGLIGALTEWVLDAALAQVSSWQKQGHRIPVAVNLSPRGLLDLGFPDQVAELLRRHGLGPDMLTLELTETTLMSDPERTLPLLNRLHDAGIAISIDDFGTGYSSLAYLRRLPVDEVKIDKSFIRNLGTDEDDSTIVRAILELTRSLGLAAVAEGVEDELTRDALSAMGCPLAQGYLFSRPLPADVFHSWLTLNTAPRPPRPLVSAGPRHSVAWR